MTPELESMAIMSQGGVPEILFIGMAMIANVFPAIPEEVFLLFFGYLTHTNPAHYSFWEVTALLIVGLLIVDSIVYYLAFRGNKFINFVSRKLLKYDLKEKEGFFHSHINKTIFISRFLVQLRALGPIIAGTIHHPFKKFLMVDFLALVIYVPSVMGIGYYFSTRIDKVLNGANALSNIMTSVAIILGVVILMVRLRKTIIDLVKNAIDKVNEQL